MDLEKVGWGGRIRTYGTRYQKALPYRLATPQREALYSPYSQNLQDQKFEKTKQAL